jgi:serine/threonine protein kinase
MRRAPGPLSGRVLDDGIVLRERSSCERDGDYYCAVHQDRAVSALVLNPWMAEIVSATHYLNALAACPSVDHPAVARILRSGQEGDLIYVTSDHLGEPIGDAFEGATLDVPRAIALGRRVAEGLSAIHAAGAIHGGLSARSIFLPDDGEVARARIAVRDLMPRAGGEWRRGQTVVMYGAPPVLGDELFEAPRDPRSDLASLSLTLYQLLGGHLFLQDESLFDAMKRYATGTLMNLRHFHPDVPDDLAALLAKTHAPDRNTRPQSAEAFCEGLMAVRP